MEDNFGLSKRDGQVGDGESLRAGGAHRQEEPGSPAYFQTQSDEGHVASASVTSSPVQWQVIEASRSGPGVAA